MASSDDNTLPLSLTYITVYSENREVTDDEDDHLQGKVLGQPWLLGGGVKVLFFLLRLLVGQGGPGLPQSSALRLFIVTWLLFGVVITAGTPATLLHFLTSPAYLPRVCILLQLAESDLR